MDTYITGTAVKRLRNEKGITQQELAQALGVSDKAVSKWETSKGLPDITLIEPLAKALGVSVGELFSGEQIKNKNIAGNMLRSKLYVCPVCGNVIHSTGEAVISCCGISLPALEGEEADGEHRPVIEKVEDEYFISFSHSMTKSHYISFAAYVTTGSVQTVKFYPEGNAEARFKLRGSGYLYFYCNKHGLMKMKISRR